MWSYIAFCVVLATAVSAQDPRCNGAHIIDGFGYLRDINRCDCWIRCTFDEGAVIKSERQCCQCGMFWNQNVMTCFPARDITCPRDRCAPANVNFYNYPGNCRTYWSCDGSRTSGGLCCPIGQAFDSASQSCVDDDSCTDDCLCTPATTLTPPTCPFLPDPTDAHNYIVVVHGVPQVMSCAPGSNYNATACKCSTFVTIVEPPCPPDFSLQCNTSPLVDAANDVYIMNEDVGINTGLGHCLFGGRSELLIPRYANMDWRSNWAVFVSFNGLNNSNVNGPLFSNSACQAGAPSINLRLSRSVPGNNPIVVATINTPAAASVQAAYKLNEVNKVYLSYDGVRLHMCVEYEDGSVADVDTEAAGLTTRSHCTVRYGQDENNNNFRGIILDSRVYIYCVPLNGNFCPQ